MGPSPQPWVDEFEELRAVLEDYWEMGVGVGVGDRANRHWGRRTCRNLGVCKPGLSVLGVSWRRGDPISG